eukprot:CAMPEP_0194298142 /NCGR_PEP_ID=MMETSP0169-20130528/59998_1 /TAXON_ID=218684 /ORGANISM="Corethron pennatum, Strain L29A3" /LENGTH=123 /DNA_ID=CAMNT_0039048091 /DNA_START=20 /DNA_END=391 /DNA_ORIENTATION=-
MRFTSVLLTLAALARLVRSDEGYPGTNVQEKKLVSKKGDSGEMYYEDYYNLEIDDYANGNFGNYDDDNFYGDDNLYNDNFVTYDDNIIYGKGGEKKEGAAQVLGGKRGREYAKAFELFLFGAL